jgi:D-apiose dehydrogenase
LMRKQSGLTVTCNMSYASRWEFDRFPQTMIAVEGTHGGVSLGSDFAICTYDEGGEHHERVAIPHYDWVNPAYAVVHSSMVECHRNLLAGLRGEAQAETTCDDNLRTLELVYASYDSAVRQSAVKVAVS